MFRQNQDLMTQYQTQVFQRRIQASSEQKEAEAQDWKQPKYLFRTERWNGRGLRASTSPYPGDRDTRHQAVYGQLGSKGAALAWPHASYWRAFINPTRFCIYIRVWQARSRPMPPPG